MKKKIIAMLLSVVMAVSLTACGSGSGAGKEKDTNISSELTYDHSMELTYAEEFSVDYYNDGYALATVADDGRYLIVPEGKEAPDDLAKDIIVLKQPLTNIYLVASAVMDMFVSIDALDSIRFSSQKEDGWYIEAAKQEMEAGNIIYAGKYSAPDYEQILSEGCGLAIENTMIYHTPEVKEQLEKFNIPVSIDTYKAKVARAAVEAGAGLINDIWGFKGDPNMAETAAALRVPCCVMHNRNLETHPYHNLMEDVLNDLKESIRLGLDAGVRPEHIITDPGIGFGKTLEDNLLVMKHLERLKELGYPILLGTSRKSMIGLTLSLPVEERVEGTVATTVFGVMKGCSFVRVHDVKENYRAMKMTEAMIYAKESNRM